MNKDPQSDFKLFLEEELRRHEELHRKFNEGCTTVVIIGIALLVLSCGLLYNLIFKGLCHQF